MQEHLKKIADSYDRSVDLGKRGIDSYRDLPKEVTKDPNYKLFVQMQEKDNLSDSGRKEIQDFLQPEKNMKFVDLGCCLNLMFRGYDKWHSIYYGVDISPKTIELLEHVSKKYNYPVGELYCGGMHATPFETGSFDIGCCIGSLEYFKKDYIEKCLAEFARILKAGAKFVLDIPNVGSKEFEITSLIEKSLGREDHFDLSVLEFERLLSQYFIIQKKETVGPMIQYFIYRDTAAHFKQ